MLFIGQAVSQLGDWFNSVAVFALLLDLTGSATAVAWLMIVQFLPMALLGPIAGVVVDRVDRRRLMIAADVVRGGLALGLLLVRRPEHIWLVYAVTLLSVSASAFFEPARTATIPNVTTREELLPAQALSSAAWATMLAVGAAVGGLVTNWLGRDAAFVINGGSFFVSACFIGQTALARRQTEPRPVGRLADLLGWTDIVEGFRYMRQHAAVAALMFVKAGWGLAGGVLLLLTIFGQRVFPVGHSTAAGIGVLYGARGIGAGLGPLFLRRVLKQTPESLRACIGPAYFVVGIFYAALAAAPTLPLAALCVLIAHFGGAILWVFSTILLQMEVPDRFRGRVFSAELAFVTITSAISTFATAYAIDRGGWSPQALALALGLLFAVPGILWLLMSARVGAHRPLEPTLPILSAEEEELEGRIG
jgi:MFS family permease